jgi:hypothetical protein
MGREMRLGAARDAAAAGLRGSGGQGTARPTLQNWRIAFFRIFSLTIPDYVLNLSAYGKGRMVEWRWLGRIPQESVSVQSVQCAHRVPPEGLVHFNVKVQSGRIHAGL